MANLPPVPEYDATPDEVRAFLTEYFKTKLRLSDSESLEWAEKLHVDGTGLYQANEDKLFDVYGFNASPLFNYLQNSKYGRNSNIWIYIQVAGYVVNGLAVLIAALAYYGGQKDTIKWVTGVGVLVDVAFFLLFHCCSRPSYIANPKRPEWTKARNWGSPTKERWVFWKLT